MPASATLEALTSSQALGLWLQAALTLAILSFLWADNPIYKLAEHIFVGISAGYGVVLVWHQAALPVLLFKIFPGLSGGQETIPNYWVIIPGVLGLMMLSRFLPKYDWVSRWPIAFVVGITAGSSIPVVVQASLLEQMQGTLAPFAEVRAWALHLPPVDPQAVPMTWFGALNALLLLIGVISTLSYFYFSAPHRGALGWSSKLGVWFLMVAFGAGFGNTVMARISLLIGRVQFMLYEWWPVACHGISPFLKH